MHHLVNRTAILSQNHRIREKMLHACTPWGATCTTKQGRIVQTQNFIFGQFSNFFFLSKWDLDPPTHFQIIFGFLEFFNFAKPLCTSLQDILGWRTCANHLRFLSAVIYQFFPIHLSHFYQVQLCFFPRINFQQTNATLKHHIKLKQ